jgi:hypothetical protein
MGKVKEPSNSECYTPSSEPFTVYLDYVASNFKMTNERRNGKNMEGSGRSLIEVLYWNLPDVTEEK